MKRPDYTCPKKEEVEDLLKELSDCTVADQEIDALAISLKKKYREQYSYYIDQILHKLEKYREACGELRDYCEYLEKENKQLKEAATR